MKSTVMVSSGSAVLAAVIVALLWRRAKTDATAPRPPSQRLPPAQEPAPPLPIPTPDIPPYEYVQPPPQPEVSTPSLLDAITDNGTIMPSAASSAGRGLMASRDVAPGETILTVTPEACAPAWPCDASELSALEVQVCRIDLGAGTTFLGDGSDAGAGEGVPSEASDAEWVAGEVQAFWLLAIRCALLSRTAPDVLAAMLLLEHHSDRRQPAAQRVIDRAAARFHVALQEGAGVEMGAATLAVLFGVLLTNSFGIRGTDQMGSQRLDVRAAMLAFSLHASLLNHACEPNARTDHRLVNGVLSFRATRPIKCGAECVIAYTATEEPTYVRQRELARSKHFRCGCALCTDPFEGGRCGSYLRCTACAHGWQGAQPGALDCAHWQCVSPSCGATTALSDVLRWDDARRTELSSILSAANESGTPTQAVGVRLRAFIASALSRCHPNHALLLQARLALVAFGFDEGDEGDDGQECRRAKRKPRAIWNEEGMRPVCRPRLDARGLTPGTCARPSGVRASAHECVSPLTCTCARVGVCWIPAQVGAAKEALLLAERILPATDPQKADLLFQIGIAHHGLAHDARIRGQQAGQVATTAAQRRTTQQAAARDAAEETKAAAEAMLRSARLWADACTEGSDAAPAKAAREFAKICWQLRRKQLRGGAEA